MSEITVALDEGGANDLFNTALTLLPLPPQAGNANLGPFFASYSANAQFVSGAIDLIAPGSIRIDHLRLNWQLSLSFGVDLNDFLPQLCFPQVCVDIPCVGTVCTPGFCIGWPTITVPVNLGDFVEATADFGLDIALVGGNWRVRAVVQNVSQLQFGPATAGMLVLIGLAITPLLLVIPFIGPFVAIAVNAILAAIGIAGMLGFLGPIISPFVSGIAIPIYEQPQHFQVLPAAGPNDPAVFITLDAVTAEVRSSDEDELVVGVDISA